MRIKTKMYDLLYYICNKCIRAIHTCSFKPIHLSVNSGRWFFLSPSHGANLYRNYRTLFFYKSSVAFFMPFFTPGRPARTLNTSRIKRLFLFLVKGFRLVFICPDNKKPFFPTWINKNSISENFPQCEQCPKPDNSRPNKAGSPGKSLDRNNSLSPVAGLLYGAMLVCDCPTWFYRDRMAMLN